ncbi:LPS assembly protein LptD [Marinomonas mediterranea]|uniref:LPS-assembly protein LptD n=1 Tax=Marinomonas mediterranea TaxID=119864 RepID=UPI002349D1A7|nr:LPS assembly protein LptD [Marinomonas mediterranea]WCN12413.1 LPS assembly protein LptD [Marinomonas mediterranea]
MAICLRNCFFIFPTFFIFSIAQANEWDWVPRESLTTSQKASLNKYCSGAYIDNWRVPDGEQTQLLADVIYRDASGNVHMKGQAELIQPESTLEADTIDGTPNQFYQANGDVTLRAKNQIIRSDSSQLSEEGSLQDSEFNNARFLSHNQGIRGEAKSLVKSQSGVIFIKEGFYTSCEPNSSSWELYGSSITLDPNTGFGTAKHVQIRIDGNPIFYFPWLRFPIDSRRQTGFLFPSFGYSSDEGFSVSAPFYWNLAPNYDATITPHFVENEGEGVDVEFRHLSPYGTTTIEQSTFIDEHVGEKTLRKFNTEQTFNQYLSAGLLIEDNPTKDGVPLKNTTSLGEKDNYEHSAFVNFNAGNFSAKVTQKEYQTPDKDEDRPLEWLPRIDASYQYANTWFNYKPVFQYTDFLEPDEEDVDGERTVLNQTIELEASNAWGTLSPGILHQYRDYNLYSYTDEEESTSTLDHLSYYLDGEVVFERSFKLSDQIWRQTLTPKFTYLYAPYLDQSDIPDFDASETTLTYSTAFNHTRFSGNDRIGDTNQVAFGLESKFYDGNGSERWAFKAGQVFYQEDRRVDISGNTGDVVDDDPRSSLLTSITYKNGSLFSLTNNLNYDLDEELIDLAQISMTLTPDSGVVLKSSFSYEEEEDETTGKPVGTTKQSNISAIVPLNQNWHLFHQQTYDLLEHKETKKVTGLGFENCCVKMALSYQSWLNDSSELDQGIYLQFILRSLSNVGRENSDLSSVAKDYWNNGNTGY